MENQALERFSITCQTPRKVVIWTLWRNFMRKPRPIITLCILAGLGIGLLLFASESIRFAGVFPLVMAAMAPLNVYRLYAKGVDADPVWTSRRTFEFTHLGFVLVGPEVELRVGWKRYRLMSEDAEFFYLHLAPSVISITLPKAAFGPGQADLFREYATKGIQTGAGTL
jgi:hypothetical protein